MSTEINRLLIKIPHHFCYYIGDGFSKRLYMTSDHDRSYNISE